MPSPFPGMNPYVRRINAQTNGDYAKAARVLRKPAAKT